MIAPPEPTKAIVDQNGKMQNDFAIFALQVAKLEPFLGTGSPEGVLSANQGQFYIDTNGASGSVLYVKRDTDIGGDATKGWILV